MIKSEGHLGFEDRTVDGTAEGDMRDVSRSGNRRTVAPNTVAFGRARTPARDRVVGRQEGRKGRRTRQRNLATVHGRRSLELAAGPARHEGNALRTMSVDCMPSSVGMRFLAPGWGRKEHLCLIHDDISGDIVAFGYGRDHAAARFVACKDLQAERRAKVTLAICPPGRHD